MSKQDNPQIISAAKSFMLVWMGDNEIYKPSDFDDIIAGKLSDMFSDFQPRWNRTVFFFALGELIEEGRIKCWQESDQHWCYQIVKIDQPTITEQITIGSFIKEISTGKSFVVVDPTEVNHFDGTLPVGIISLDEAIKNTKDFEILQLVGNKEKSEIWDAARKATIQKIINTASHLEMQEYIHEDEHSKHLDISKDLLDRVFVDNPY